MKKMSDPSQRPKDMSPLSSKDLANIPIRIHQIVSEPQYVRKKDRLGGRYEALAVIISYPFENDGEEYNALLSGARLVDELRGLDALDLKTRTFKIAKKNYGSYSAWGIERLPVTDAKPPPEAKKKA